jgi:hypothetical protein
VRINTYWIGATINLHPQFIFLLIFFFFENHAPFQILGPWRRRLARCDRRARGCFRLLRAGGRLCIARLRVPGCIVGNRGHSCVGFFFFLLFLFFVFRFFLFFVLILIFFRFSVRLCGL